MCDSPGFPVYPLPHLLLYLDHGIVMLYLDEIDKMFTRWNANLNGFETIDCESYFNPIGILPHSS